MEQTIEQPTQTQEPPAQTTSAPDPYALDETQLSTLAPEARVAFDGVTKAWREKAEAARTSAVQEATAKYKDYDEQKKFADALRQLSTQPWFVQAYNQSQQQQQLQQQQQQQNSIATPEMWAQAVQEMAAGNPAFWNSLQQKQFMANAAPFIKDFQQMKTEQAQDRARDALFSAHPDADELDIQEGDAPSLLEMAVYQVVDKQGGTWEQAYQYARSIADGYKKNAKDAALGLVNGKKASVTEQTSQQSRETENVVEVASAEEALRKNVEAAMRKQNVTYVAKNKVLRR